VSPTPPRAYLAGPDVFLPDAVAHAGRKIEICRRHGLLGLAPLNEDVALPDTGARAWQTIFDKDIAMMQQCDLIIANLTPFGGASADAGTLIEVGWFLGQSRPIFGYSNTVRSFEDRMRAQLGSADEMAIEGFHLPDNLMIVGAVQGTGHPIVLPKDDAERGMGALDVFEACVAVAAAHLLRPRR
jgi:nucleoside 2-deoxyribosyltransferase